MLLRGEKLVAVFHLTVQHPALPGATLPILAPAARAMKGDRETCLAAGADEYVSKPIDIDELLQKLEDCLA